MKSAIFEFRFQTFSLEHRLFKTHPEQMSLRGRVRDKKRARSPAKDASNEASSPAARSEKDNEIQKVLQEWSNEDSSDFLSVIVAMTVSCVEAPEVTDPSNSAMMFDKIFPPEQQQAYARYVFSSGKLRKECVDPFVFMQNQSRALRGLPAIIRK